MTRLVPVLLLSACATTRAARSGDEGITLELATRPGRWCSETVVTYEGTQMRTERLGCDVELAFDLVPARAYAFKMPAPDERSAPIQRVVSADTIARRQVTLSDPRGRSSPWQVRVADDRVGPDGIGLTDARSFDFRRHRFLVFDISDSRRDDGAAFPFRTGIEGLPWQAHKADPAYCATFAHDVHLYPATGDDVATRTFNPADELDKQSVACSHTHDNVFLVDLGAREEGTFDVAVTLDNRDPVLFRLTMHPDDNYAVVHVVVRPSEL